MKKTLLAVCLAGASCATLADGSVFNYNFVQGDLVHMTNDELDQGNRTGNRNDNTDGNGLRISGGFDLAKACGLVGSVMQTNGDDFDVSILTFGGSYHHVLPAIADMPFELVVKAEIEHIGVEADRFNWDDSETGFLATGGVQMQVIERFQVFSNLSVSTNEYTGVSLDAGARYEFVPHLAATAAIEVGDIDMLSVGLRYSF